MRPAAYHISKPDPNIDQRRCRNLVSYFTAHSLELPASGRGVDWQPGDVVFWDTDARGKASHVGVIANGKAPDGSPTVVHHWPGCPVAETDGLYNYRILHHFRWKG